MITITEIDKMSEIDRIKLMENWSVSELTDYLCPNGMQSRQMNQWYISSKCPVTVLMLMILSRYSR
ncbi:MAG: hypothetical protein VZR53_13865 [Prevotella sp.]|jgi:hypothetical protein|nr:hypothetical protein [Prevotella sp.]